LSFPEGTAADLPCPRQDEAAFERRLAAAEDCAPPAEATDCLLPADLKTTGPEVDIRAVDVYIATVCQRARRMGLKIPVYGSGGSRRVPEGFDHGEATAQITDHLKRWGPMAAEAGLTFVLEPLHKAECNIVNTAAEGAAIARAVGHPNVRLLAETYHTACDDEEPAGIIDVGALLAHAHCAEARGRAPLGLGGEDHRPYFRTLKAIGYTGRIAIEAKWEDFQTQLPQAVEALSKQIQEA